MESRLLEILVCPVCKGNLHLDKAHQELVCRADKLAFPIRDGVPIMLENEARALGADAHQPSAAPADQDAGPTK